jgi:hypothetical protein
MKYEYQVLEADSPAIPPSMLNEQGDAGWEMCGVNERHFTETNDSGTIQKIRWIYYFKRVLGPELQ